MKGADRGMPAFPIRPDRRAALRGHGAGGEFRLFLLDQTPPFTLQTAFCCIEDQQLASLLQLGVAQYEILTSIVVIREFRRWLVGVNPIRRATAHKADSNNQGDNQQTFHAGVLQVNRARVSRR